MAWLTVLLVIAQVGIRIQRVTSDPRPCVEEELSDLKDGKSKSGCNQERKKRRRGIGLNDMFKKTSAQSLQGQPDRLKRLDKDD